MEKMRPLLAVVVLTSQLVGCLDRLYGPAIRNDFDRSIYVEMKLKDRGTHSFTLKTGAIFAQRIKGISLLSVTIQDETGAMLLNVDADALSKLGPCLDSCLLTAGPNGLRLDTVP